MHPDWATPVHAAAAKMQALVDVERTDDPLHRLDLHGYAYGTGRPGTFCRVVEQETAAWVRISLGNVSAHRVGLAKDGTWRIGKKADRSERDAEAMFADVVEVRSDLTPWQHVRVRRRPALQLLGRADPGPTWPA